MSNRTNSLHSVLQIQNYDNLFRLQLNVHKCKKTLGLLWTTPADVQKFTASAKCTGSKCLHCLQRIYYIRFCSFQKKTGVHVGTVRTAERNDRARE